MATETTVGTSYAGEAKDYISAALLSGKTISEGGITVKANIKKAEILKKLTVGAGIIQNGGTDACDFQANSTVALAENTLTPKDFKVNLQLCKAPFRADYDAMEMGVSAHDVLPKSFEDFLLAEVAAKVAAQMELNIWQGVNANAGEFDGLTVLAANDSNVIDVVGTTITAGNVIDELGKAVDAIPAELYGAEDMRLFVPQGVYRAYVRALGGFASAGQGANGVNGQGPNQTLGGLEFDGVKIFVANGMPANTIMATQISNIFFGTGLLEDHNEVKVIDMSDIDGSDNVRVIMKFTGAVGFAYGSEVVLYS